MLSRVWPDQIGVFVGRGFESVGIGGGGVAGGVGGLLRC